MSDSIHVTEAGESTLVVPTGALDASGAPRLRAELIDLIAAGHDHLVVDLDQVEFIDSTGLGVLVGALKRVRTHGGDLRLVVTTDIVMRPLRITGLHRVFDIRDNREDAIDVTSVPASAP